MNEMIKRVARAIADCTEHPFWEGDPDEAVAAIKAMREPTTEMIKAGEDLADFSNPTSPPMYAEFVWQAMIDEALKENQG